MVKFVTRAVVPSAPLMVMVSLPEGLLVLIDKLVALRTRSVPKEVPPDVPEMLIEALAESLVPLATVITWLAAGEGGAVEVDGGEAFEVNGIQAREGVGAGANHDGTGIGRTRSDGTIDGRSVVADRILDDEGIATVAAAVKSDGRGQSA
jgi:hypothetical protein